MKNGLIKFLYHDTTMIIPLANAIFDGKINIKDFFKKNSYLIKKNLHPDLMSNLLRFCNLYFLSKV